MNRKPLVNKQIRAEKVRVIDETGKQLGVMTLNEALQKAQERDLDLIQVTEKVEPPVCKIMDYGKYLYQQKKKEKGKAKAGEIKGIRLKFGISEHDLEVRAHQAARFLKQGNKIRIEMQLRGREKALADYAKEKINKFLEILSQLGLYKVERELKREPRGLTMILKST